MSQNNKRQFIHIPSESFSSVLFSGVGAPVDANLSRTSGKRIWLEEMAALGLLYEKMNVILFMFDVAEDKLYFVRGNADGERDERRVSNFSRLMAEFRDSGNYEERRFARIIQDAVAEKNEGIIEYLALIGGECCKCRTVYRSLTSFDGEVYAVVGHTFFSLASDDEEYDTDHYNPITNLFNQPTMEILVNEQLRSLREGEKGIMLILNINQFEQLTEFWPVLKRDGYLRTVADAIRADFRGDDLIGHLADHIFMIFIHGRTSIDVIERRAQCLVDLFQRIQSNELKDVSCSVGVTARTAGNCDYNTLVFEASQAMETAASRGANRYRLYDDDKY